MGAPGRPVRRLSAAFAAFLLLTLAAVLAPQDAQAQSCGTLSPPTVTTASGAKQLTVSWGALSAGQNLVGSWELRYRKTGATNWITRTIPGASIRSIVISGLEAATTYQVKLKAIHQTGTCSPSSDSAIATGTTLANLVLTVTPGDGQVGLSWTWSRAGSAIPDAWVYRKKQGSGNYGGWLVMTGGAAARSFTVTGLTNGTAYTFQIARQVAGPPGIPPSVDTPYSNEVTATPTPAGVTISETDLTVAEGSTGTYTVKLNTEPTGTVTVTPSSNDTGAATVSPASLTFNSGNYNTAKTVTVTGESDTDARNETVTVSHAVAGANYASVTAASVTVTVTDDDNPAAPVLTTATSTTNRVINLTWTHAGTGAGDLVKGAATFSNWRLEYRRKGGGWGASGSLGNSVSTRNAASPRLNYPDGTVVEVRVRATGYVGGRPTHGPVSNVREVTFKNDDKAALTIVGAPVEVAAGATATYTVALTDTYAGTLRITSGATDKATVDPATLTFTTGNYNTAQTVTVTGVEAGQATINHAFRLTGATADMIPDAGTVSVTVNALPAKPANFAATAGDGQVTLNWSDPDDATITGYQYQQKTGGSFGTNWTAMSGSGASTTSHTVGSLTNGTEYTFRIRAVSAAGNGAVSDEKSATPVATVPAGVTVSTPTLTVAEGGSGTYTMRLNTEPSDTVTVTVGGASGDVTVEPASLTFTASNWRTPQTVTVRAARDEDVDTDANVTLTHSVSGGGYGSVTIASVVVSVTDTTPTLQLLTDPAAVTEGTAIALTVTSDRAVPGTLAVSLTLADRGSSGFAAADIPGGLGPRTFNAAFNGGTTATVTIATSRDSDTDEGAETWRITLNDAAGYAVGTDVTADGTLNDGPAPPTSTPRPGVPRADAGSEIEAAPGSRVRLDGSGSTDPDGGELRYSWRQVLGWSGIYRTAVALEGADTARPSFTAPAGPYTLDILVFRLTVTDPEGKTDTDSVWVTVGDAAPMFGDASVPALELAEDAAMAAVTLPEATGGNGTLTYTLTSTPAGLAGLAFDPETRRLSGTPPESGSWTFTYRADDADSNRSETDAAILTFTVTVRDDAPVFGDASVAALDLAPGAAMAAVTLPEATGGNGTLTYTLTSTPAGLAGLAFDPETRRLSGTPPESGSWTFTYRADDADSNRTEADAAILTFTVTVRDETPTFGDASVPALDLAPGAAMTAVTLPEATGGNGALSYTLTSAPTGLAGLAFDPETRRLSGTPPESGSWTFTWRADDADANRTEADAAILTFEVRVENARTALVKQTVRRTLAAVARRALTGALDNIGARMAAEAPMSGLTLAGETVPLAVSGAGTSLAGGACAAGDQWRHGLDWHGPGTGLGAATADCGGAGSRTVGTDELLNASAFSLGLGAAEGEPGFDPHAPRWAVWGRGDYGTFEGRPDGMRYDGEMRTGWLGIDARAGAWVAGLAVSHGTGEADYGLDGGETGRLETELTAVYPYGRWTVSEGLELRGVLGAGWGEARHRVDGGVEETGDLSMRMASLGLRHALPPVAGIDLAARADASVVRMETDEGPDPVHGLTADSWRLRAGVEASRRFALDDATALTPFVEAAARRDGGDGLTGTGLEIAGGVRWTAPRVQVEARGRWLAAHTEDGAAERGVSVTARVGPGAQGRGLSLMLSPRWGAEAGGAEALWRDALPAASAADSAAALDARIGYGLGLTPWGLLTPFAETGLAGDSGQRLRLGTRFDAHRADMAVELAGEHREGGASGPEQTIRLDLTLRY